jgi:hypothetical protein
MTLKCNFTEQCANVVSHIGSKGYTYCKFHGERRTGMYERVRRLTASELTRLATVGTLERYSGGK